MSNPDSTLNLKLDNEQKKQVGPQIRAYISRVLGSTGDAEDTLLDYIFLLIANNRPKGHVANDLDAFFGREEAIRFTDWLWDLLLPFTGIGREEVAPVSVPAPSRSSRRSEERDTR